jgi:hypothetical protein
VLFYPELLVKLTGSEVLTHWVGAKPLSGN